MIMPEDEKAFRTENQDKDDVKKDAPKAYKCLENYKLKLEADMQDSGGMIKKAKDQNSIDINLIRPDFFKPSHLMVEEKKSDLK